MQQHKLGHRMDLHGSSCAHVRSCELVDSTSCVPMISGARFSDLNAACGVHELRSVDSHSSFDM
jgi:hypothetical protein